MRTFRIRHETTYRYRSPVSFGDHRLVLKPRDGRDQRVIDFRLEISPSPTSLIYSEDVAGNIIKLAAFGQRSRELKVVARATVEQLAASHEGRPPLSSGASASFLSYRRELSPDLVGYVERQFPDHGGALERWARGILAGTPGRRTWPFLLRLNGAIRRDFAYLRREHGAAQAPVETLQARRGACRDFAVLMCEAARTVGLAARLVSGYLHVPADDDGARCAGGATHAWLQVYLPGPGWIDFDPTSGTVGNRDLVRVAVVRDLGDAAPLGGSFVGFADDFVSMSVNVQVEVDEMRVPARAAA